MCLQGLVIYLFYLFFFYLKRLCLECLFIFLLPEKTALVCSVDAAVIEPVQKPGKDGNSERLKFDGQTLVQQGEWLV